MGFQKQMGGGGGEVVRNKARLVSTQKLDSLHGTW
jgi:hypothetical protein